MISNQTTISKFKTKVNSIPRTTKSTKIINHDTSIDTKRILFSTETERLKQLNPPLNIENTNTGRASYNRARSKTTDIQHQPANKVTIMFLETIQC